VTVEKGDGVAAPVQPDELAARVHQPQQELPGLMPLAVQFHGDFKEVDLGFVAHAMNQRYIDFCPLAPSLAQVLVNRSQANLITFFQQSAMQPHPRQPLLRGRARLPFGR